MGYKETEDCYTRINICLEERANIAVVKLQAQMMADGKRTDFNKQQAINRIIKEWSELKQSK